MPNTRPLQFVGGRYTVEFTVEATRQARALDWSEFERVQGALYDLASTQGWVDTGRFGEHERHGPAPVENTVRVGHCAVLFEVVPERNVLRVTAVDRDRMPPRGGKKARRPRGHD
jgi:hypothetical protein